MTLDNFEMVEDGIARAKSNTRYRRRVAAMGVAVTRNAEPNTSHKWASVSNRAFASAICGNSGVGENPASAGPRTSWASVGRPVDW
jgi:hypothetical protein